MSLPMEAVARGLTRTDEVSPGWALSVPLDEVDTQHVVSSLGRIMYGGILDWAAMLRIPMSALADFGLVDDPVLGALWLHTVVVRQEQAITRRTAPWPQS